MAAQHSGDFRRRLKQLNKDDVHRITTSKDMLHPSEQMNANDLAKLHDNIKFTQTVMGEVARERWEK